MKSTGNKPPAMLPARSVFMSQDLDRNAAHFNVPLLPTPSNFFSEVARDVIQCQRLLIASQNNKGIDTLTLIDSLTDGVHTKSEFRDTDNNLKIDENFLIKSCESAGLTSDQIKELLQDITSKEVKAKLISNTEQAVEAGAYGSPTMIIHPTNGADSFFVFGSDRFEQIAHVCGKTYLGPDPSRPKL